MDPDICVICGSKEGDVNAPANAQAYFGLCSIYNGFKEVKSLPDGVLESEALANPKLLSECNAKWHKACKLKLTASKLERTRERLLNKRKDGFSDDNVRKSKRSLAETHTQVLDENCIFCKSSMGTLHRCSTMQLDQKLKEMATALEDSELLAKISGGDLVAIEAKYHNICLTSYKNKYRAFENKLSGIDGSDEKATEANVLSELISHIENCVTEGQFVFKFTELHKLYEERLKNLGYEKSINKLRLKLKIKEYFADVCDERSDGKNTILVFGDGFKTILKDAEKFRNYQNEALAITSTTKLLRDDMQKAEFPQFSGSFSEDCQRNSVPNSLKSFIAALLFGSDLKGKDKTDTQSCLTICQLILFNFKKQKSASSSRHSPSREPPLPLFVGLNIHALTRNKKMIKQMSDLGISVSYSRVLQVEDQITAAACQRYSNDNVVCPTQLKKQLFTVGAFDNIDYNPSSSTAEGSFHGTSISVFQFPSRENPGIQRELLSINRVDNQKKPSLPESYLLIPPILLFPKKNIKVPSQVAIIDGAGLQQAVEAEEKWITEITPMVAKDKLNKADQICWAAYHASRTEVQTQAGISVLLPLFSEKAATLAMVKHGMSIVKSVVEYCNPGQIPVFVGDQPIFALAKQIQWQWPDAFGEKIYMVMLGGLHIEMAIWRALGNLVEDSGWTSVLAESGIVSAGTAESLIKVTHLKKTRHFYEVTAVALQYLQIDACSKENGGVHNNIVFKQWHEQKLTCSPMFQFWDMILKFIFHVLILVRSHRQRNYKLYIEVLETLVPWFFALNHPNYARWLPVHIKDLKSIPDALRDEFMKNWSFAKTSKSFSSIPLDQAHEHNNKKVKTSGGAVGLTENPSAFKRWMISGPELSRLAEEFPTSFGGVDHNLEHHEQGLATQETFKTHVSKLIQTISAFGNPFTDHQELANLTTCDIADPLLSKAMSAIELAGKEQYQSFVSNVLISGEKSIFDAIKRNNFPLFKRPPIRVEPKSKQKINDLKCDTVLFSQLYVACQLRQGDLSEFFSHENHAWPPSLSEHDKIRLPTRKAQLLELFESAELDVPCFHAKIYDGATVIHGLSTGEAITFKDYCFDIFWPYLQRQLMGCSRIDIVFDTYKGDSLKESTREKRGEGVRKKVANETRLPKDFSLFLRNSQNKEELFRLLAESVKSTHFESGKSVYITHGETVICNSSDNDMSNSNHEEADSRMILHIIHAALNGSKTIMISSVDTDVFVILVGQFYRLKQDFPDIDLWLSFGKGKFFRYYHINSVCCQMSEDKARSLPFFHAYTGSDTTSQFAGKGKKSAWKAWTAFPAATEVFSFPWHQPFSPLIIESKEFALIEQYTCFLYSKTTSCNKTNDIRQELFTKGKMGKVMQSLPPSQDALLQHTNRALYQASIWLSSHIPIIELPSPDRFGWKKAESHWRPLWITIPEASASCRELIKCGCKAIPVCSRNCICNNNSLECTALCKCKGSCERDTE